VLEKRDHRYIGTEHILLGIVREENCRAAQILQQYGLRVNAIREELARSPAALDRPVTFLPHEMESELPKSGVVPDADVAKRIAEAVWVSQYGADTVERQAPFQVELKFNIWIVNGSSSTEALLYAFILRADGRVLSVGGPSRP